MSRHVRWARVTPVTASVIGALLVSGSASGVTVPEVGVPSVPPLVPTVETPPAPTAPAPAPTLAAPEVQQLVEPEELQDSPEEPSATPSAESNAGAGNAGLAGSAQAAATQSGAPPAPGAAAGSPYHVGGSGVAATAASAMPHDLSPAQRRRFIARRRAAYERQLRSDVKDLLGCVYAASDFEAAVLVLRAGVSGKPLSRARVAKRLRTSRTRVRRAESRGLRRLKSANRTDGCGAGGGRQGGGAVTGSVGDTIAAIARTHIGATLRVAAPPAKPQRKAGRADGGSKEADGGGVAGVTRTGAAPTGKGSDGAPFLLLLLGIALLASVLAGIARGLPAVARAIPARRPKPVQVRCDFCSSTKVAVNPVKAVYRCAGCGFSGVLPAQVTAGLDNMQEAPNDRRALNPTARH